jgi:tetratricopeptide (TPR) repeat protein
VESLLASVVNHVEPQPPEVLEERKKVYERILAEHPDHAMSLLHYGWWHIHTQDAAGAKIYFEKALTVDPFNVRLLEAVMSFYRIRDSVRYAELTKRLEQIVPETAEERLIGKTGPKGYLFSTIFGFMETADASLWAEFVSLWKAYASTNPVRDGQFIRLERLFLLGTNDLEGLIKSTDSIPPPNLDFNGDDPGIVTRYFYGNMQAMQSLQLNDREQEARKYAEQILPYQSVSPLPEVDYLRKAFHKALAAANAFIGNSESAKSFAKEIEDGAFSQGVESGDVYDMADAVMAWAWIDADYAASLFYKIPETQRTKVMGTFAFSHVECGITGTSVVPCYCIQKSKPNS